MFLWFLPPLWVGLFILGIDFGGVMTIRLLLEKKIYFRRWWAFRYGDTLFLPLYGYFMAHMLQQNPAYVPHVSGLWTALIVCLGYLLVIGIEYRHTTNKVYTNQQQKAPSQVYHSLIFPFMFYLVITTLPVLAYADSLAWAVLGAWIAIVGYARNSNKRLFL